MRLYIHGEDQGQTIVVSYGWHEGELFRHTLDRSDGSVVWHVADEESATQLAEDYTGDEWNAPHVQEWTPCSDPCPASCAEHGGGRS